MTGESRPARSTDSRNESPAERDDRNLAELLQELRVAGLGVQVLFGYRVFLAFAGLWLALPLARRERGTQHDEAPSGDSAAGRPGDG
jgi:hypothetical protein